MTTSLIDRLNPVLEREIRERMRSRRSGILVTFYLGSLIAVCALVYQGFTSSTTATIDPTNIARMGRTMFEFILFFMLLLVLFLVPGLTSGAIAGERERQTLLPVQVSLLRPRQIVVGKVWASFAFLSFLLVITAPLLTLAYVIGGVSVGQVFAGLAIVVVIGFTLSCFTVACSAMVDRVQAATVLAYIVVLLLTAGSFIVYGGYGTIFRSPQADTPTALLAPNPFVLVASVVGGEQQASRFGVSSANPFTGLRTMLVPRQGVAINNGGQFGGQPGIAIAVATTVAGRVQGIAPAQPVQVMPPPAMPIQVPPDQAQQQSTAGFTLGSIVLLLSLSLISVAFASYKLRTPARTER